MEKLVIDFREKAIIEELKKLSVTHDTENLVLGDMFCYFPNNFQICIERKTWQDLWASIIDGRYREQRSRILEWINDHHKVIYILEGNLQENKDTCLRTILRLSIIYDITVYQTKNVQDTALFLKWFHDQKNMFDKTDPLQCQITQLSDSMVKHLKKKKDVQQPRYFLLAVLQSITGISYDIAQQIVPTEIESIKQFMEWIEKSGIEVLSDKLLQTKNGKSRKLGLEKAKRICDMFGISF
jgi:ERCC4-type nuclease